MVPERPVWNRWCSVITDPMATNTREESKQAKTPLASELSALLNRYSRENKSGTPDFILAEYLIACLKAYEKGVVRTAEWHGVGMSDD